MEHGAVVQPELEAVTHNLLHTYVELGRSTTGSRVWKERGFHACTGELDHPICNFAVDLELNEGIASRLRQVAAQRRCFSLYTVPPIDQERHSEILHAEGFALSHKLQIMIAETASAEATTLLEASEVPDRRRVADFMVDQFFHKQPTPFKRGISEATARSTSLKLFKAEWNNRVAGAVMVSEHANIFGIYNLCVAPQFRSCGWGASIVRSIVEIARSKNCGVTLQCVPNLAPWYGSLGFREVGEVSVYGLFRFKEIDIIG